MIRCWGGTSPRRPRRKSAARRWRCSRTRRCGNCSPGRRAGSEAGYQVAPPRIGLIGCGFIGRFHARAFRGLIRRGLIDAEYVAVCDHDEERARSFAEIADVSFVMTDAAEVIDSPDVDVVYVCVPTAAHRELVLRAAERGKHVFCEKPLATTLADVEEMVTAVAAAGVKAGGGLGLRHPPVYTVVK